MKLPGVSGVYDYAGPNRNLRYRSRPCCLPPMQKRRRPDCQFSELNTQPTCTPVYASPNTSRCTAQNSGPSGSLLLSRRTLAFPASCRFIPAHCIGLDSSIGKQKKEQSVKYRKHRRQLRHHLHSDDSRISHVATDLRCRWISALGAPMMLLGQPLSAKPPEQNHSLDAIPEYAAACQVFRLVSL